MEKAAREEGHCSKREKPCQERGRGLRETKGRREGEASRQAAAASAATGRRGKAAEKEPIGCCAPAYLEAARYFLPKLFQLSAVLPSSTENLLLSLDPFLPLSFAVIWLRRIETGRVAATPMRHGDPVLFGISMSMYEVRCGGCAFMED